VGQARAFADQERYAERIFTWKVLNNVEAYARTGFDLDGALGVGIILGRYPREYPATGSQACGSVLWSEDFATYVRRYYKPPSNWREYCRKFNGPRPIFVV
jgi:hypothetical protein